MAEKNKKKELTPKQERFCQLYVSEEFFGHGTESYAEAYGIDLKTGYGSAKTSAARLLTNANICARINELLKDAGLNDGFVDKQLLFLISQHADFAQKMAAIREYNKLRQRITDKMDVTTGGEKLHTITVKYVEPEQEDNETTEG